jgi:hypothetical protein
MTFYAVKISMLKMLFLVLMTLTAFKVIPVPFLTTKEENKILSKIKVPHIILHGKNVRTRMETEGKKYNILSSVIFFPLMLSHKFCRNNYRQLRRKKNDMSNSNFIFLLKKVP